MIFLSAGHLNTRNLKHKTDPGAVGVNGRWEADEAVKIRDRVTAILVSKGYNVINDGPQETLREYLARIKPGPASVVLEYHFDAAANATGTSTLVGDNSGKTSQNMAAELTKSTSDILGIKLRDGGDGDMIIFEKDSHRGRLGLMREKGIVALLELCFISNPDDLKAYDANKEVLAGKIADILIKYDALI